MCAPVRTWDASGRRQSPHFPQAACTRRAQGVLLPERYPPAFPAPLAYFPLTAPRLNGTGFGEAPPPPSVLWQLGKGDAAP